MTRNCKKCHEKLIVNEKLGYMECLSGLHIEPINLNRPQWWNQCPKCGNMGLNEATQERYTQRFDDSNQPLLMDTKKGKSIVFAEKTPEPITCRACGFIFSK